LFVHVDGVRNIQDGKTIAPGIDVRGQGGYVCFPPLGGYRVVHEADIAEWPDWLLPLVLKASEPAPRPELSSYATPAKVSDNRLRGFIDREVRRVRDAPNGGKHNARLAAARSIGGVAAEAGLSDIEVEEMLIAARPPEVEEEKERRTIRAGLAYGRTEPIDLNTLSDSAQFRGYQQSCGNGGTAPLPPGDGTPPPPPPGDPGPQSDTEVTKLITAFNHKYFVLNENGRAVIYAPKHDPIINRRFFERISFADLERLYSNRMVKVGEKDAQPVYRPAARVWLTHRGRKQFIGGVVFDPSTREQPPDILNLWRGFAVEPRPGSWGLMKDHVRTVICRGDQALFDYVLDWIADLVQRPARQGEVCLVLCGAEGSGKGVLARTIKHLLGQHGLAISNGRHLTGNFNAHLRDTVFLFADEAFYAGDKAHVGVLKALITEPYLTIEGKYQNAVQAPNFLHIMMASNEAWVVPASLNSRRFVVLSVDSNRTNDHAYFGAIQDELDRGGYEAMLHELIVRTPIGNLRAIPLTEALQTQRKLSLGTTESWWLECLHRGYVFRSKLGLEEHFRQWHETIATDLLVDSYAEFCRTHRERHPLSRELLGKWLRTMGCKPTQPSNAVVGERIGEVLTPDGHTHRAPELVRQDRPRGYHAGSVDAARQAFINATGLAVEWAG
jgi:Family of unknown function (DUF5906)